MNNIKAQILKIINGGMTAVSDNVIYDCEPNGKLKKSKILVGDIVKVWVLGVEVSKKRISLTMRKEKVSNEA